MKLENKESRIYSKINSVVFAKTDAPFGGLSNMAPGFPLLINDQIILTSEALYQAMRYPLFPEIQQKIIEQNSPMTAKMISKKHLTKTRQDWNDIRIKMMRWSLEVKLAQNWIKFGDLLRATGERDIIEFSTKDQFWGAKEFGDDKLQGVNALGRLLMELRNKYVHANQKPKCTPPLHIIGFLFFGFEINNVCDNQYFETD